MCPQVFLLVLNVMLCIWVAWSFQQNRFDHVWWVLVVNMCVIMWCISAASEIADPTGCVAHSRSYGRESRRNWDVSRRLHPALGLRCQRASCSYSRGSYSSWDTSMVNILGVVARKEKRMRAVKRGWEWRLEVKEVELGTSQAMLHHQLSCVPD
jgi:hypothetical protein